MNRNKYLERSPTGRTWDKWDRFHSWFYCYLLRWTALESAHWWVRNEYCSQCGRIKESNDRK